MANVKTQSINQNEWLLSEAEGTRSREQVTVTVADGVLLPSGTVLGQVAVTKKYVKHADSASDGSQTAVAILATPLDGTDIVNGDYPAVIFARDCEGISTLLNGGAGPSGNASTELRAVGIVPR